MRREEWTELELGHAPAVATDVDAIWPALKVITGEAPTVPAVPAARGCVRLMTPAPCLAQVMLETHASVPDTRSCGAKAHSVIDSTFRK